jgi:hypothetical protein
VCALTRIADADRVVELFDLARARDAESDDVTAVTSRGEDRFAQRRADALTTMAETTLWIIPTDVLDYDIAIGGLLSLQQKRLPPETITA